MVGGTCSSSSRGSKNAFAFAIRARRRTHSSRTFGVDLQPRRAAIIDLLAAIKYDLLAAIVNNSPAFGADPLAAITLDRLAAI